MKMEGYKRAPVLLLLCGLALFSLSSLLVLLSGINPALGLIWNLIAALDISYQILPLAATLNPLIFLANAIDAFVFALLAVAIAAIFYDFIKQITPWKSWAIAKVKKLKKHVIIVPANSFASYLSNELQQNGIESVVIAETEAGAHELYRKRQLAIVGNPKSIEAFNVAGISRAKCVIACSSDDIENALIVVTAKSVAARAKIITRVSLMDNIPKLGRAGAYRMIMPEVTAGEEMGNTIAKRFSY